MSEPTITHITAREIQDSRGNPTPGAEVPDSLMIAIGHTGYKPGEQVQLAPDVAVSELYHAETDRYELDKSSGAELPAAELIDEYQELCRHYPIVSLEDGCAEDDWLGRERMTAVMGDISQLEGGRPFCHEYRLHPAWHRARGGERTAGEAKPNRHPLRNAERCPHRADARLLRHHLPPIGRRGGQFYCRPRRGRQRRASQDKFPPPQRAPGEAQPPAPHRRAAEFRSSIRRRGIKGSQSTSSRGIQCSVCIESAYSVLLK